MSKLKHGTLPLQIGVTTIIGFVLFLLPLPGALSVTFAATTEDTKPEAMYWMTENELTELQTSLNEVLQNSITSQMASENQQQRAEKLQTELLTTQTKLLELQNKLLALQNRSAEQERRLSAANESFRQYAAEEKRTRLRLKAQRNSWEAVAGAMLIGMIAK